MYPVLYKGVSLKKGYPDLVAEVLARIKEVEASLKTLVRRLESGKNTTEDKMEARLFKKRLVELYTILGML